MTADHVAVLVAGIAAGITSLVLVVITVVLSRRVRELGQAVEELRRETVPLVRDARVVVDQAATEMVRVGDVLDSAEAVSATVDSASRLAYRALSNPVVKILAYGTGMGSAVRRFFGRGPSPDAVRAAAATNGHASVPGTRRDRSSHTAPTRRRRRRTTGMRS
ncbi:MAG TPA: hypothetical protein VMV22_14990 [Acidimicrobiales bacterium]|nr:hypothetical protein [Acidimicrobiales bacterium]